MVINQIKEELENLEELEFKEINERQKKMLNEQYNFYTTKFKYAEDDYGNVVFICTKNIFKNMEYYLGLEFERDQIEYKFSINKNVIVSYSGSERVEKLLEQLQELE